MSSRFGRYNKAKALTPMAKARPGAMEKNVFVMEGKDHD